MDNTEKQLRQQLSEAHKFIMKHGFSKKPIGQDDYVDVCKFCNKEGFGPLSIKHPKCEIGKLLK